MSKLKLTLGSSCLILALYLLVATSVAIKNQNRVAILFGVTYVFFATGGVLVISTQK